MTPAWLTTTSGVKPQQAPKPTRIRVPAPRPRREGLRRQRWLVPAQVQSAGQAGRGWGRKGQSVLPAGRRQASRGQQRGPAEVETWGWGSGERWVPEAEASGQAWPGC